MDFPDLTIVMTTLFLEKSRRKIAENTLMSWQKNFKYSGLIRLHCSDDGSTISWNPKDFWDGPITYSRQERHGVGASLNAGFREAFTNSPLVVYLVDDWRLDEPIDLDPWIQALIEREDIGIIRLGPPHPFLKGSVEIVSKNWQGWALKLDRYGHGVGHRPEIFHKRFTDYYGLWEENVNACEVEYRMSVKWADDPKGPDIYLALPHKFFHSMETPSLSEIEPK